MVNDKKAYIPHSPGDLITAEDWTDVQIKIKEDIAGQVGKVGAALEEHKSKPVDASTFSGKNQGEWIEELDKHYALLNHNHDSEELSTIFPRARDWRWGEACCN